MNVVSVAGQIGERRARFALSSHSTGPLGGHWRQTVLAIAPAAELMNLQMQH